MTHVENVLGYSLQEPTISVHSVVLAAVHARLSLRMG